MSPVPATPVILDKPRTLRWTNGAQCRLSSLPRPPEFRDLASKKKSYWALIAYLWATMVERDFETPEDFADAMPDDKLQAGLTAFYSAVSAASPKPEDTAKNG